MPDGDRAAQARDIAELAAAHGDDIDRERALTGELVDRIRTAGFFRLLVPARFGGAELRLPDYVPLIEAIAAGDASTGWCVNQAAVFATLASRADPMTAAEVWGDPLTSVSNGPPAVAQVTMQPDGHRLRGRWDFSSGCRHANWVAATTMVGGTMTVSMIPIGEVELVDVWQVQGLRGTGSFSFDAHDVFVPSHRAFASNALVRESGTLYRIPMVLMFAAGFAAVALGNARRALDHACEVLGGGKVPVFDRTPVRERTTVQFDIARAEATWGAARAYLAEHVEALWQSAEREGQPTIGARIGARLATTHAIHCAADAVQIVYRACGTTGIFAPDPLQRCFQDAHVITQQVQGRLAHYETAGAHMLGMKPRPFFF